MRVNLPVTQRNHDFPAHQTLISVTDTKGRITYCNAAFVEVSGYSEAELLGQPHNLLRHPDMPAEAFRDFWTTIQSGLLWSAVVKNRRRNGDHYWVRANATPMREGERIVGYLSVRTRPSDAEIQAAEQLYARMRDEAAAGRRVHVLDRSSVKRRDLAGRLQRLLNPSQRSKYVLLMLLPVAATLLAGALQAPWWLQGLIGATATAASFLGLHAVVLRRLKAVILTSRRLASGDLAEFVGTRERGLTRSLLLPIAQLALSTRTVMADVRSDLQRLLVAAQEVAGGSQDLASRTESQAASLEQTAAAMDQINGAVQQTAELAGRGVDMAGQTRAAAERSRDAVHGMSATMQEIADASRRIGDITQTIESVAFQTNILAINAAVEAARAGEQGRGFAVVAAEVRALAQRTAQMSKEIRELIAESQQRVHVGGERATEARARMDEVAESVQQVTQVLEQIDHAAREQALGVQQVGEAVQHMDGITQQNAALVEELAASAASMRNQAETARHNIRVFRLAHGEHTHAETDAVELRRRQRRGAGTEAGPQADGAEASAPAAAGTAKAAASAGDDVAAAQELTAFA
jgi:aerotaxis receptor